LLVLLFGSKLLLIDSSELIVLNVEILVWKGLRDLINDWLL
jgi:hypothetical protein